MTSPDLLAELIDIIDARRNETWRRDAACAGLPTAIFFPDRGGDDRHPLAICHTCPVAADCLDASRSARYGIWGGVPAKQRRRLRGADPRCARCSVELGPGRPGKRLCPACRPIARAETQRRYKAKAS